MNQSQQDQRTPAAIIASQNYEYLQSEAETLDATLQKETDKLTTLQQQQSTLEQQLKLVGRIHLAMNQVQTRLTTLENEYTPLMASTDGRIARGNNFLVEARNLLNKTVTTTLAIANEQDPIRISTRINSEDDSSTQLEKATNCLDRAQTALDAVNRTKT